MNRVLPIEKKSRLGLVCVERVADVTLEVAGHTEQKSSQARPAIRSTAYCPLSSVVVEVELASAMRIAGYAQVVSIANVSAKFDGVLAANVRPIVYELILMFLLGERAVALIHVQRIAKKELRGSGLLNGEGRHRGSGTVYVNAWNTGILGRCRAEAPGTDIHPVSHVAETYIC